MDCCQIAGIEEYMDARMADKELKRYREKGPEGTTSILLQALITEGVDGLALLDIGGGVGVLQHELLQAGVRGVTSVDASSAYLQAAREEVERRGHTDRVQQHHGDFVQMAHQIPEADIVTLDRVICCYHDMEGLVGRSAALASQLYGVVYPRDDWWVRAFIRLQNLYHGLRGSDFRAFAHANAAIERRIREAGLERCFSHETIVWKVHVYRRNGTPADSGE